MKLRDGGRVENSGSDGSIPYFSQQPNAKNRGLTRQTPNFLLGLRPSISNQRVRRCDLNLRVQTSKHRTLRCEAAMYAFDGLAHIFRSSKLHLDMDPANDQHAVFSFDLSANVSSQPATAGIDFARLQRAPEGSEHSPAGRSDNVVQGCRVRLG